MKKLTLKADLSKHKMIKGKGFYISYAVAGSGPTGDETAIVYRNNYYILNGNWLAKYSPLVKKGYKECKKLFDANKDMYQNFWSN